MLIGVHGNEAAFPLTQVTREFFPDVQRAKSLINRMYADCEQAWNAGRTVVWSFKPAPADVASGAWRPYIEDLARYIKSSKLESKVIVCIWHEPENDFANPADFVRLYNTVHGWLKAVNPAVRTTHAALGYWYRNQTPTSARAWITQADIHSIDLYSGRSFPLLMTLADSKPFATWKAALPAGAAWGVSERGFIADAASAKQRLVAIGAEFEWLASLPADQRPAFYILWNTPGTEKDPKLLLDAAATTAVNDALKRLSRTPCPTCKGTGFVDMK